MSGENNETNNAMDASGKVGSNFKGLWLKNARPVITEAVKLIFYFAADGPVGSIGQKVGGPFDKQGAVGKQFTEDGSVGGSIQQMADTSKGHGDGVQGPSTTAKAFDAQGSIGSMFRKDGAIGSVGQAVGGPLAADGMIGKNFNETGAIGGMIQKKLGED